MATYMCHTPKLFLLVSLQFWPSPPCLKINQRCDSEGRGNPNISFSRYLKGPSNFKIQKLQTMKSKCSVSAPKALTQSCLIQSFIQRTFVELCGRGCLLLPNIHSPLVPNRSPIDLGEARHLTKKDYLSEPPLQPGECTSGQWETSICVLRKLSKERLLQGRGLCLEFHPCFPLSFHLLEYECDASSSYLPSSNRLKEDRQELKKEKIQAVFVFQCCQMQGSSGQRYRHHRSYKITSAAGFASLWQQQSGVLYIWI